MLAAQCHCSENVFGIARCDHSDRNLTIVRSVGGVEGAAGGVKANLSAQVATEGGLKGNGVNMLGASGQGSG
jgi:hypothetical protein